MAGKGARLLVKRWSEADNVIDVDIEDIGALDASAKPSRKAGVERRRLSTETKVQGMSLAQVAVHSLWVVDYLRSLRDSEFGDADIAGMTRCADDLENAILLMFQLAGGTRQELLQRYGELKLAALGAAAKASSSTRRI